MPMCLSNNSGIKFRNYCSQEIENFCKKIETLYI